MYTLDPNIFIFVPLFIQRIEKRVKSALDMGFLQVYGPVIKESRGVNAEGYSKSSAIQEAVRAMFVKQKAKKNPS